MNRNRLGVMGYIVTLSVTLLTALPSSAIEITPSLCKPGEKTIFSCSFAKGKKGVKFVSFCLQDDFLSYRFGKPGSVELEYPAAGVRSKAAFKRMHVLQEGYDDILTFTRTGTNYTLDESTNTQTNASSAILSVSKGEKTLATMNCADDVITNWPLLDGVLPISAESEGEGEGAEGEVPAHSDAQMTDAPADAGPAAKADEPGVKPVTCAMTPELRGFPREAAGLFRQYAEKTDSLYTFAVKTFGAPTSCTIASTIPEDAVRPENPDAVDFHGKFTFVFKGATLIFENVGRVEVHLNATPSFPSEAEAKTAFEARAGFAFKGRKPTSSDEKGDGTHLVSYSDQGADADGSQTTADMIYRGKKLVGLYLH